jgi:protease PrsW
MELLFLALAPVVAIGSFVWLKDKYEREPLKHVIISFLLGVLSAIPAVLLSHSLDSIFPVDFGDIGSVAIHAFIVVALAEEFAKFLVLKYYAFRLPEFNEPYDGIVYGVMISLGFAAIENIFYVMDGGMNVALLRMFTAVPAHASFGIIMGYYFGLAWQNKEFQKQYMFRGLFSAVMLHGVYDFFLLQQNYPAFWIFSFIGLAISIKLSLKAMKAHNKISPFRE